MTPDLASMTMSSASITAAFTSGIERQLRRRSDNSPAPRQAARWRWRAAHLGEAVHRFFLQRDRAMRVAVPFGIDRRIGEAEIGREIENAQMLRQAGDHLLRGAVRQAAEDEIDLAPIDFADLHELRQVADQQMRKHRADVFAGLTVRRQRHDLGVRDDAPACAAARRRYSRWRRGSRSVFWLCRDFIFYLPRG